MFDSLAEWLRRQTRIPSRLSVGFARTGSNPVAVGNSSFFAPFGGEKGLCVGGAYQARVEACFCSPRERDMNGGG